MFNLHFKMYSIYNLWWNGDASSLHVNNQQIKNAIEKRDTKPSLVVNTPKGIQYVVQIGQN